MRAGFLQYPGLIPDRVSKVMEAFKRAIDAADDALEGASEDEACMIFDVVLIAAASAFDEGEPTPDMILALAAKFARVLEERSSRKFMSRGIVQ